MYKTMNNNIIHSKRWLSKNVISQQFYMGNAGLDGIKLINIIKKEENTLERQTLDVKIKLDEVFCREAIDGFGKTEPYLWRVFFKIDGDTVSFSNVLKLSGTATIHTIPGSHGNLNISNAKKGTHITIPTVIGEWQTSLKPIPVPPSMGPLTFSGYIGVVCILMEEDNVSDDGAEAGHAALNNDVQAALDDIISTRTFTNKSISRNELKRFKNDIHRNIDTAIIEKQSFFKNIWSVINYDD
ncbi:MAG: hypothetical protein HOC71_13500, partial [Candidatus Latescibacteria bacterium]|nr:hypothetical protein [Candidatus Latescibacterota bacterium]